MNHKPLRLLIIGAHPDDADAHAGGLAALYAREGHEVKMISLTNGEAGHHEKYGPALVKIRRTEAAASGRVIGADYEVWDFPDGRLEPTLEVRARVIREIRLFQPDLVLSHRTNDYHPDHRAAGHTVRDASYLLTVPAIEPEVPILRQPPVIAYLGDQFTKPYPLQADIVVDVGEVLDTIISMLACHESQFFEWLPFNKGTEDSVPSQKEARHHWLFDWWVTERLGPTAQRYRDRLIEIYGPQRGSAVEVAEAFEISEYGASLPSAMSNETHRKLFPFLP